MAESKKQRGQKIAEKLMEKLGDILSDYNHVFDTISNQKPLQTLDYEPLLGKLDSAISGAGVLEKVIEKEKIEIPDILPFIIAIRNAAQAYRPIVEGLADKANRTGKYGWFAYRRDLKNHEAARRLLNTRSRAFSNNIETVPGEPVFMEVTANVLDRLSDDVLVEQMEIPEEDYHKFKDKNGVVYAMRAYEAGEPKTMLLQKKMWDSMKSTFVVSPKQKQADVDEIMNNILGNNERRG